MANDVDNLFSSCNLRHFICFLLLIYLSDAQNIVGKTPIYIKS